MAPMLRDAALAANVAWLVVVLAYLLTAGDLDGGSLFVFLVIGIGFPLLNLFALLRNGTGEAWRDRERPHLRP